MDRYFFHTADGALVCDEEGVELPSLDVAREEGARLMAELLRDDPHEFWGPDGLKLSVTDASGLLLFELSTQAVEAPSISQHRSARS